MGQIKRVTSHVQFVPVLLACTMVLSAFPENRSSAAGDDVDRKRAERASPQDVVHFATGKPGDSGKGYGRLAGQILDYNGRELRLKLPGGKQRTIPAERVAAVETAHSPQQEAADNLFAAQEFSKAVGEYQLALKAEQRVWVRRQIVAQLVWSCRATGDLAQAGDFFLLLLRSDPHTQFFDCIPLAWLPGEPSGELERKSRQWMGMDDSPAAVLLGASHLLLSDAAAAKKALQRLETDSDVRVAGLARAQGWRLSLAGVTADQVEGWLEQIERMPEPLRGGPYFLAGLGLARSRQAQPAALALLRAPILYPQDRRLAARALLEAGRQLEALDQQAEAHELYRQVLAAYPQDPAAAEAGQRMQSTGKE